MAMVRLGRTDITVEKTGFGALPIQRVTDFEEARDILHTALENGITYYDTARMYTDSEEKLGYAFAGQRDKIILATKTHAKDVKGFWQHLETSLRLLKTDCIDVYQFHNPDQCYRPGDGTGMYEAMLEAKAQGKIRFIGITNHTMATAREAVLSELYDTLQFPFSYLNTDKEVELVNLCKEHDVGFICMKGLAGGLITNSAAAYAYIAQFDNALPIWGIQKKKELMEFIAHMKNPPTMTEEISAHIEGEKAQLSGSFCRGCGYCMPCPVGIQIPTCARMDLLTKRNGPGKYRNAETKAMMDTIKECINCRKCASHCPYGLDTPALLQENLRQYEEYLNSDRP